MKKILSVLALVLALLAAAPTAAAHKGEVKKHLPKPPITVPGPGLACRNMLITAYTATGNPTASGRWPIVGHTVAAYWAQLPKFTWILIKGIGIRQVEDTGSAIGWDRLDVFVTTVSDAYALTGHYDVCWPVAPPVG